MLLIYIAKLDSLGGTNVKNCKCFNLKKIYIKSLEHLKGKKLRYIEWSPLKLRTYV